MYRFLKTTTLCIVWFMITSFMMACLVLGEQQSSSSSRTTPPPPFTYSIRLPGKKPYDTTTEEDHQWERTTNSGVFGVGREYSLFESRGGSGGGARLFGRNRGTAGSEEYEEATIVQEDEDDDDSLFGQPYPGGGSRFSRDRRRRFRLQDQERQQPHRQSRYQLPPIVQRAKQWWASEVSPSLEQLPKIVCRIEPTTTLKLRKTVRPLKTIVRMGADYNTQLGVWKFQSTWEDAIIGGKLTLAGKELQLSKSWQLSVGAVEDLVTRLRFRAAINLETFQAYARVGFRTERLSPINVMEGFTILKKVPLDGKKVHGKNNIKLEVKATVALPEPEIEYSTESQRKTMIGMGDVEVSIDEMNLLLDY